MGQDVKKIRKKRGESSSHKNFLNLVQDILNSERGAKREKGNIPLGTDSFRKMLFALCCSIEQTCTGRALV